MIGIAKFEKVSYEQYKRDCKELGWFPNEAYIREAYDNIRLPQRATICSAGYDFFAPVDIQIPPNQIVTIPTGLKCTMNYGWLLQICPRSGLGIKYGLRLANTIGIIDGDYYDNPSNEGHIIVKPVNDSSLARGVFIPAGMAFCQGIFLPFGITTDDDASGKREGGFGSTNETVQSTQNVADTELEFVDGLGRTYSISVTDRAA